MNRREALGLLLVAAEGTVLPTLALASPGEESPSNEPGLTGRVFQWTHHGWAWGGRAKQDLRRAAMRVWSQKPGWNEAYEREHWPEETGTFLASAVRFHGGPKLGGIVHIPGVYDREAAIPYLARMERTMEKSLMFYNLLGTTDHACFPALIAERYPGEDTWAKVCSQWRKDNEWV